MTFILQVDASQLARPDSPCIARCTTAVGDNVCRGCGRTFGEISQWCFMDASERETVWRRLPARQWLLLLAEEASVLLQDMEMDDEGEWGVLPLDGAILRLSPRYEGVRVRVKPGPASSFPHCETPAAMLQQLRHWLAQ